MAQKGQAGGGVEPEIMDHAAGGEGNHGPRTECGELLFGALGVAYMPAHHLLYRLPLLDRPMSGVVRPSFSISSF